MIKVFDRIKEFSINPGTGNFLLQGAAFGYRPFSSVYLNGDICYYAAVCDDIYEVGSGIYSFDGTNHYLSRNVIVSTNSNSLVDFPNITKEVFVTYPAKYSVFSQDPVQNSGIAFFTGTNSIDSSELLTWDGNRLNIFGDIYPSGGVFLPNNQPINTDNLLYNSSGELFFNGQKVNTNDLNYINVYDTYNVTNNDYIIFLDPSLQNISVNLPSASGIGGKKFVLKRKTGINQILINPASGEHIDGHFEFNLTYDYESISLISDNLNWYII